MKWSELTSIDFKQAVEQCKGVCLLPLGVIEKHGNHLPLGTDLFTGMKISCKAAEIEPAIVFPEYYFTQIHEAKHQPGCIAIRGRIMWDLLENICDEIARNGLRKIIFVNSHGGNNSFLRYFVQMMLEKQKKYIIYSHQAWGFEQPFSQKWEQVRQTKEDGHAGEEETSIMSYLMPELLKMDDLPCEPGSSLERLNHLLGLNTPVDWYSNYPDHYAGDGHYGTCEKGEMIFNHLVERLVKVIKAVKSDTETYKLYREFFSRIDHD
ncbi:MAG: creatininase family protein [bacterium]